MTIYSVKINKYEVVKTTALHEAINLAKRTLIDKLAAKGLYPISVSEKMYLNRGTGKAAYRVFATVWERRANGGRALTYSNCVRMEHISNGNYNFALHKEISDALDEAKKTKAKYEEEMGAN